MSLVYQIIFWLECSYLSCHPHLVHILLNGSDPLKINFRYNKVLKKETLHSWRVDLFLEGVPESLSYHPSGLLLVNNGFLTLQDLCFLEKSAPQAILLCEKQVVTSEHIAIVLYWLKGVVEEVCLFLLVSNFDRQARSPFMTTCRCDSRTYEAHARFKPKPFIVFCFVGLDHNRNTSNHISISFLLWHLCRCIR